MNASEQPTKQARGRKWILWTLIWLALSLAAWQLAASGLEWQSLVDADNPYGVIIFAVLMTILPAFGFPISPFYIFAGAAFDPWLIIPVGLVSLAINMSVSYALARYVWREPLKKKFATRWPKLFAMDNLSAARLTILVRAVPGVPFPVQNCLLGVLATPFGTYIALSLTIQGCFLTGVVLTTRGALNQNGQTALWGGLIVGLTLLSLHLIYKQRAMRT